MDNFTAKDLFPVKAMLVRIRMKEGISVDIIKIFLESPYSGTFLGSDTSLELLQHQSLCQKYG